MPLKNRTTNELYEALDKVLRLYNGRGFTVKEIHCDREFKPLMDPVKDMMGVEMHYPPAGDHVPQAERLLDFLGSTPRCLLFKFNYSKYNPIRWVTLITQIEGLEVNKV